MTPSDIENLRQNRVDYTSGALHVINCIKNDIMFKIVFGEKRYVSFEIDRENIATEVVRYFKKNNWDVKIVKRYNQANCVFVKKIIVALPKDNPINKKDVE